MKRLISTIVLLSACAATYGQSQRNLYGFEKTNNVPVTHNLSVLDHAWAGGLNSAQVSTMDLDLDGTEDLVIFDRQGKNYLTFLTKGSGSAKHYEYAPQYEDLFPQSISNGSWAFLRDYNCDGKKDLFFADGSYFYVWENTSGSSLSFTPANNGQRITSQYGSNSSSLYVNSANIPGLTDINGDGAIDLLTYVNGGIEMEYHKGQTPCGLNFELEETCWGHFTETGFTRSVELNACTPRRKKTLHDGSAILPIDLNNDQVKDLVLGNISFSTMTAVFNGGTKDSAHMTSQDTTFPSNDPVNLPFFPGGYYEDVDFDGKPDLLLSPSLATSEGVNQKSLYRYKNTGSTGNPTFNFQEEDFLQGEMIDIGERAVPHFVDLNDDDLMDMVVSNTILRKKDTSSIHTYYYYANTGTATNPAFTLLDSNFMDIQSYGIAAGSTPTFGDLDNDGDMDAIIGELNGDLHYFTNSSASAPNFSLATAGIVSLSKNNAAPFLYDIDSNGTLDLLVGNELGTVYHYSNSSSTSPNFSLETTRFGGFSTKGEFTYGYSIPYMFRNNGVDNLFVGSYSGGIYQFDSIATVISTPSVIQALVGTGNITSSNTKETPFGITDKNGRNQFLIRASELRDAGAVFGYINSISINVTTSSNNDIEHLYVRAKNTTDSVVTGFETGMTSLISDLRDRPSNGWYNLQFNDPFLWDGTSNLLFEICFRGQPNSKNVHVQMTDVGWNANAYGDYIDPTLQGNGCAQPYLSVTTKRPNVSFSITPALSNTENYGSGLYTAPAIADLNDDGFMDMVVGNMNGGLTYYSGKVYDVGIDEIPAKEIPSLNVYPNPGHGKFTIAAPYTGNTKLAVYDLNGRLVLSKEVTQNETQINLENQPVGIYLFIMQNEDGLRSAKVLKQ